MSFAEICRRTGINARQRIIIIRCLKQYQKGDYMDEEKTEASVSPSEAPAEETPAETPEESADNQTA